MSRNANKQAEIKELESKGVEWLANALYTERKRMEDIRQRCEAHRRYDDHVDFDLKQQNNRAAAVLRENGIEPLSVIVEYIAHRCQDCPVEECYYEDTCEEVGKKHVSTLSFWSFDISEDSIYGILRNFEEFENEVLSVRDKKGNVLWKSEVVK